jgi:hypothetical protein
MGPFSAFSDQLLLARSSSLAWRRHVVGLKALEKLKVQEWECFVFRQTLKLPKLPSNSLVDLMMHRGTIACAEIRFKRNNSPSNFNAMCHARVMYEAAVEAMPKTLSPRAWKQKMPRFDPLGCDPSSRPQRPETQKRPAAVSLSDCSRISAIPIMKANPHRRCYERRC